MPVSHFRFDMSIGAQVGNDYPPLAATSEGDTIADLKLNLHIASHVLPNDSFDSRPTRKRLVTMKDN